MKYELMYIISKDVADEQKEAIINKFSKMVEDKNGKIISLDKMGLKKFAYPIAYKNEGFYVLMTFEADSSVVAEMTAMFNITESVVRHLFIAK